MVIGAIVGAARLAAAFDDRPPLTRSVLVRDLPELRAALFSSYDSDIALEASGHLMSNGQSWNDVWLRVIAAVRQGRENPETLVTYIVERRRTAGLPELTDYVP